MALNRIVIMGRLARDPEIRKTGSGVSVASFCVAVDRDFAPKDGEKETDWIDCVAWRHTAEFVGKYFQKGSMIVVSGRLQTRSYTDKEGIKRKASEIVADNVYFGGSKKSESGSNNDQGGYCAPDYSAPSYDTPDYSNYEPPANDFAMLEDDDAQLPF